MMQNIERGMRRLEAHPKHWVKFEFDKIADVTLGLREYCVFHDGGVCEPKVIAPQPIDSEYDSN